MKRFNSQLAPYIAGFITQKQASGFIYGYESYILGFFDRFCIEHDYNSGTLTREMVMQWAIQRPTESKNYRNQRVSFVRQLAFYMHSLGMNPYIPQHFESEPRAIPHIFSRDELVDFFKVVDDFTPCQSSFWRLSLSYRVMFRLFYCCGLRLSEVCYLRRRCVDLKSGVIRVLQSKGDKDRLVYLADDVSEMCHDYDRCIKVIIPDREWFFPGRCSTKPFGKTAIDKKFEEFWSQTCFAGKIDRKPTIHGLRHTFVVDKMNEWMLSGIDADAMMPYLSRYLGHSSIQDTQYYFHTIEQAFPVIRRCDAMSKSVIPEVVPYEG